MPADHPGSPAALRVTIAPLHPRPRKEARLPALPAPESGQQQCGPCQSHDTRSRLRQSVKHYEWQLQRNNQPPFDKFCRAASSSYRSGCATQKVRCACRESMNHMSFLLLRVPARDTGSRYPKCRRQANASAKAASIRRANAAGSRGRSPSCTRARSSSIPAGSATSPPAASPAARATDQFMARIDLQHRRARRSWSARRGAAGAASAGPARPIPAASTTALSTSRSVARTSDTSSPSADFSAATSAAASGAASPSVALRLASSTGRPHPGSRCGSACPRTRPCAPARRRRSGRPAAAPRRRGRGSLQAAPTSPARRRCRRPGRRSPPAPASCATT